MRRSLFFRPALALCFLFAFATSAGAECAGVLWNMLNITKTGAGDPPPTIGGAFERRSDCVEAARRAYEVVGVPSHVIDKLIANPSSGYQGKTKQGEILVAHNRCLPDTLDLRAPKAR
jgi:hypothetical protein